MVEILGFSQNEAVKLGLTVEDLVFFRWYILFSPIANRNYNKEINDMVYSFSCDCIYNSLPIIFNDTKIENRKKLEKMLLGSLSQLINSTFSNDRNEVYLFTLRNKDIMA